MPPLIEMRNVGKPLVPDTLADEPRRHLLPLHGLGMHAHRGYAQRFAAVRSHDLNAHAVPERQPFFQPVGNQRAKQTHGRKSPEKPGCPGTLPPRTVMPG